MERTDSHDKLGAALPGKRGDALQKLQLLCEMRALSERPVVVASCLRAARGQAAQRRCKTDERQFHLLDRRRGLTIPLLDRCPGVAQDGCQLLT